MLTIGDSGCGTGSKIVRYERAPTVCVVPVNIKVCEKLEQTLPKATDGIHVLHSASAHARTDTRFKRSYALITRVLIPKNEPVRIM